MSENKFSHLFQWAIVTIAIFLYILIFQRFVLWWLVLRSFLDEDGFRWWAIVVPEDIAHLDISGVLCEHSWLTNLGLEVLKWHSALVNFIDVASPKMSPSSGTREVDIARSGIFLKDRGHQNVFSEHELAVLASSALVVGEVKHEGSCERCAQSLGLIHKTEFVVSELYMDLNKLFEEKTSVSIIVDLNLSFRNVWWVSTLDWVRESVHLDPTLQGLLASGVFHKGDSKFLFYDGSITTDIGVTNCCSTHSTVHKSDQGWLQAILWIKRSQLISHPVKTRVFTTSAATRSHEVKNIIAMFRLI